MPSRYLVRRWAGPSNPKHRRFGFVPPVSRPSLGGDGAHLSWGRIVGTGPAQVTEQPVVPAYGDGCVTELMAALLGIDRGPLPAEFASGPRVLLILDGLGWEQFQQFSDSMPTLAAFSGDRITTVAPSTTAAALTSIATALPPGEHGLVGYRMVVDGQVFNSLRWGTRSRPDARATVPPRSLQPYDPFLGQAPVLVTKAEFRHSGFTEAHLRGGRLVGYRTPAILVHEVARMIRSGEHSVYAYYDGIDKVAHEYGLGSEYQAELAFADWLVADLIRAVPAGTTVMVSADHGQVDCGPSQTEIHPEVLAMVSMLSGEARFRWLHAKSGAAADLLEAAREYHGHQTWIYSIEQLVEDGWLGPTVLTHEIRDRLGDVALLPFDNGAFADPHDTGPFELIGRHGSATAAEMYVPCVAATA